MRTINRSSFLMTWQKLSLTRVTAIPREIDRHFLRRTRRKFRLASSVTSVDSSPHCTQTWKFTWLTSILQWPEGTNLWASDRWKDQCVTCVRWPLTEPTTWMNIWRQGLWTSLVNSAVSSIHRYPGPSTSEPVSWQILSVKNVNLAQHRKQLFKNTQRMSMAG